MRTSAVLSIVLCTVALFASSVPESNAAIHAPVEASTWTLRKADLDLFSVRSVAVVKTPGEPQTEESVRNALQDAMPSLRTLGDRSDLLIEYSEYPAPWVAPEDRREPPPPYLHPLGDGSELLIDGEDRASWVAPEDRWELPPSERRTFWHAYLFRFDCQNATPGGKPVRAIDGICENRVYVRVLLGRMEGSVADGESAARDFAARFRDSVLAAKPATERAKQ